MKKTVRLFLYIVSASWCLVLEAGHLPGPPPQGPGELAVPQYGDGGGSGQEGILPVYPVSGPQHQMPLEAIPSLARQKYSTGGNTWAHEWKDAKENQFLLPHLALEKSQQVIDLSGKVFKNFNQEDISALKEFGNPILPLLIEQLNMPSFPSGWGSMEKAEYQTRSSALTNSRKTRLAAIEILLSLKGPIKDPYMYLALVDPDEQVASKAFAKIEKAEASDIDIDPILLLLSHHKEKKLTEALKKVLGDKASKVTSKIKAIHKAVKKKDLYQILKDKNVPDEAIAIGLAKLDIPVLKGDEKKAIKKMREKELKQVSEVIKVLTKRYEKVPQNPTLTHVLLWEAQAKLGNTTHSDKLLELTHHTSWWMRLLCARICSSLWEHRMKAIPILLERQRDLFYEVRRQANDSLRFLNGIPMSFKNPPTLQGDSFTIDLWEKWWISRQEIAELDSDEGWETVTMKAGKGKVYSPTGPTEHSYWVGKYAGEDIALIDHNENGKVDFSLDNFVTGNVKNAGTFLSRLVRIKEKYYFLRTVPQKTDVQLKPYTGPLGTIEVKEDYKKGYELGFLVISKSPDVTIQLERSKKGKPIKQLVPAGHYNIFAGNVAGKGSHIAHLAPGLNQDIVVPADEQTVISPGQDLFIDMNIKFHGGPDRKEMWLELSNPKIHGNFGEMYFALNPEIDHLKVVFKSLSGKKLKVLKWNKEGFVDKTDEEMSEAMAREAERMAQISQLENDLYQIRFWISRIEFDIQNGPPYMGGATLQAVQQMLADYRAQEAVSSANLAILQGSNHLATDQVFMFQALRVSMAKFPEEFTVDFSGETFFGKIRPVKIQVKGSARQEK